MIGNVFNSQKGSGIPDVNINSKAFDELSIVKRFYDQAKAAAEDLKRVVTLPPVVPFARSTTFSNSMTEGQSAMSQFAAQISSESGLAKPSWFKVVITRAGHPTESRFASLFCDTAQFPSHNISTSGLRTYGPPIQLPYLREYEPVQLSFLVDTNMRIMGFFNSWMNSIVDDSNLGSNDVGFSEDYVADITIYQLSPIKADDVYSVKLINAYPKLINQLDLSYQSQNEFHRLQVQFVYEKIVVSTVSIDTEREVTTNDPSALMRAMTKSNSSAKPNINTENDPFGSSIDLLQAEANAVRDRFLKQAQTIGEAVTTSASSLFSPETSSSVTST
jgi:hypothetical protein